MGPCQGPVQQAVQLAREESTLVSTQVRAAGGAAWTDALPGSPRVWDH